MSNGNLPKIHVIQRWISELNMADPTNPGIVSGDMLDQVLSAWVERGYKIIHVLYLGKTAEGFGYNYTLERTT